MNLLADIARLRRLAIKEIRETLYDRRTILTLVVMPLVIYPLLAIGIRHYAVARKLADSAHEIRIGVGRELDGNAVSAFLRLEPGGRPGVAEPLENSRNDHRLTVFLVPNIEAAIRRNQIHVGIRIRRTQNHRHRRPGDLTVASDWEMVYNENDDAGRSAAEYVARLIDSANRMLLADMLKELGADQRPSPIRILPRTVSFQTHGGVLLAAIPLILLMMTSAGAVYPAIDLTAGERERGTLEVLVAAPVPRFSLLLAKYVAVVLVAVITAAANLVMMILTLSSLGMWALVFGDRGFSLTLLLEVFALMPLFAAFFSAVLLALSSFARSFKEGQAYLIPVMLFSMAPGFVSMMPGLELSVMLALTPLLNIILLGRDLLSQEADPLLAAVVIISTATYALLAIAVAARTFGSESVLYGAQYGWSDLFLRPAKSRPVAALSEALMCLAMTFPTYYFATILIARLAEISVGLRLLAASLATAAIFALLPLATAWWRRIDLRTGFALHWPNWIAVIGAILLGSAAWTVAHEIVVFSVSAGWATFSEEHFARVSDLVSTWRELPLSAILIALAIVPAVCEELYFRGFLLAGLRQRMGHWQSILLSAILFGLFHLITSNALAIERLIPSTLLGVLLGWAAWKSGSVLASMILHAVHNGLLVSVAYFQTELAAGPLGTPDAMHLPWNWLVGGAAALALGIGLIAYSWQRDALDESLRPSN